MTPKERIKHEAIKLFRAKGYERTTVRDIAQAVGIQSGSLFHHFASKEAILKEAFSEAIAVTITAMQQRIASSRTDREALLGLVECELNAVAGQEYSAVGLLIQEWRSLSEESQAEMLQLRSDYEALWQQVLSEIYQKGGCRLEPFLLRKLLSGALGWVNTWFKGSGDYQLSDIAQQVVDWVLSEKPLVSQKMRGLDNTLLCD